MSKTTGTIKWFDNAKGFGFLINEAGEDVFVHYREIIGEGYKTLIEGQKVEYIETTGSKGLLATEVTPVE